MIHVDNIQYPNATIKFELIDENGFHYVAESTINILSDIEPSPLDILGKQFATFLRQAGYSMEKQYLLMRSVDEEEYEYLENCLNEYRQNKEKEK